MGYHNRSLRFIGFDKRIKIESENVLSKITKISKKKKIPVLSEAVYVSVFCKYSKEPLISLSISLTENNSEAFIKSIKRKSLRSGKKVRSSSQTTTTYTENDEYDGFGLFVRDQGISIGVCGLKGNWPAIFCMCLLIETGILQYEDLCSRGKSELAKHLNSNLTNHYKLLSGVANVLS